ncbi:MAG: 30S ribosomal protein S18 [Chloroflexi bacterium]|nr:30S ribosomal protein S18 [Chloroflexota bacterium]
MCAFCVEKATAIDYKDPLKLRRYLSDRGRIDARRKTGTCAKHQRWLATALKRARHLALLPYTPEHMRVTGMFASRR